MDEVSADMSASVAQVVAMFREAIPADRAGTLDQIRAGYETVLARLPIRDDATISEASYGGVDGYWVRAEGAADDRVGVMLHGGGFVMGSAAGYRAFAAEVSSAVGTKIFVPEYRLAPEHPFPAGMEDGCNVLRAAIDEHGPDACFAIGDSAGGGLIVSSLLEMHRTGAGLPACLVLISALVDLTVSNPSFEERASRDPLCARPGTLRNVGHYLGGRGPDEAPGAFPMLVDLGWLPPSLILVGGAEVLRDDSRRLADKLIADGAEARYHEYEDMIHVWPIFSSLVPEGREALEEIGSFVRHRLQDSRPSGHQSA